MVASHGPLAGAVLSPKMISSLAPYLKSSPRHGVSGGCEPMLLLPVRRLSFHHKTLADAINRAVNGRMFISDITTDTGVEFYQKFYRKLDKRGIDGQNTTPRVLGPWRCGVLEALPCL